MNTYNGLSGGYYENTLVPTEKYMKLEVKI
jgi:hypothetical protein